ncbi:MAG: RdgB/HAM1 family non-canonical purine NTP pyrophosphatase [Nitrospinota bacterium]|nr:RdgB/HAM1 family non-canonical purine NTP pyrophosphatase [Nitrospinota bacterium]
MFSQFKFVTGNSNKVREAGEILKMPLEQVEVKGLFEMQTQDLDELVRHKCQQAYEALKSPVLVEDSGLQFNAWKGLPGALVKWFETTVGYEGMLKMLQTFDDRSATAVCCLAMHDGTGIQVVRGEVAGTIASEIRGHKGFGWDVFFIPEGSMKTYAEMDSKEKNAISHRKIALEKLKILILDLKN